MGILIALLNAFTVGSLDVFIKKLAGFNPNFLTWVRMASAVPVLAVLVTVFSGWSLPPPNFWLIIVCILLPLEILLAFVGTKSVQIAPLSLIAPLGAFSSIFLIPIGYVVLGELPTPIGVLGVLLIVVGSFILGWQKGAGKIRYGLRNILQEPGSYLALAGAFIAAIAVTVTKLTFHYASPLLAAFYISAAMAAVLSPLLFSQSQKALRLRLLDLAGLSIMSGGGIALHNVGLSLIPAVYYISVKRLSAVIGVVLGRIFFGEDHTMERLLGAAIMVVGVILIALG